MEWQAGVGHTNLVLLVGALLHDAGGDGLADLVLVLLGALAGVVLEAAAGGGDVLDEAGELGGMLALYVVFVVVGFFAIALGWRKRVRTYGALGEVGGGLGRGEGEEGGQEGGGGELHGDSEVVWLFVGADVILWSWERNMRPTVIVSMRSGLNNDILDQMR